LVGLKQMIKIEYPPYQPKIKEEEGLPGSAKKEFIFDEFRKRWVLLTPEEWVRQNFLQYLTQTKKYPASLIAIEKEIKLGELKKRFDILIYDSNTKPWMVVECKEMNIALDKTVLDQVLRYNISLNVSYLVITNGTDCMAFSLNGNQVSAIDILPNL
jgi:Type I restriction enzyme R protein N terminus (HSDR_N)